MWSAQALALQNAGHRVLTPDIGGLGTSSIPTGSADVDQMANQVVEEMVAAGWERAVIGGLSMGGYVAMAMLRVAPQKVAGLILIDTKASADDPARRATRLKVAQAAREGNSVQALARTMPLTLLSAASRGSQPELLADLETRIRHANPEAVAWCQEAMASRPDSLTTLRSAGALPALVLCGSDDEVTPLRDHEQMVAALRDAGGHPEFVVVQGAGHLAPMENSSAVNASLLEFLSHQK